MAKTKTYTQAQLDRLLKKRYIVAYNIGFEAGKRAGRTELQEELRRLLAAAPQEWF